MKHKNFWKTAAVSSGAALVCMAGTLTGFAADTAETAENPSTLGMLLSTFGLPILLLVFLYLFMMRPQMKQEKELKAMHSNLQVGDEVVTKSGIVGIVLRVEENTDTIVLETGSDRVKLRMLRDAVGRNITAEEQAEEAKEAKKKARLEKASGGKTE